MGRKNKLFAQFRPNIIIIAFFVFLVCGGICVLIWKSLALDPDDKFVVGALIGLLGSGITGLAGLGTTLVSENQNGSPPSTGRPEDGDASENGS